MGRVIFKTVRYFLTGRLPKVNSILLVESGSRGLIEGADSRACVKAGASRSSIDLVTCYSTLPKGFEAHNTRVYRVGDYRGTRRPRAALPGTGEEPVWSAGNHLLRRSGDGQVEVGAGPAHSGEDFHHQRERRLFLAGPLHLGPLRRFVLFRSGLAGSGAVRTLVRLISFPFTLLYLLLYATSAHARRALRRS